MFDGSLTMNDNADTDFAQTKRTPEEVAARHTRLERFFKRMEELDKTEPLPDNFDELCKGKAIMPVYSK